MAECLGDPNKSKGKEDKGSIADTLHDVIASGRDSNNPNTPNRTGETDQVEVDLQKEGRDSQSDLNQNLKINEYESNQAGPLMKDGPPATSARQGENGTHNRAGIIILGQVGTEKKEIPVETTSYIQPDKSYLSAAKKYLPLNQPPIPPQPTTVQFFLLIIGKNCVNQAYIHPFGSGPLPLERDSYVPNLFRGTLRLPDHPMRQQFRYKYSCNTEENIFNRPIFKNIEVPDKNYPYHFEADNFPKHVRSTVQLDVFNFEEDTLYMRDTVPSSVVFYLKWMLNHITVETLSNILTQMQYLNFNSLLSTLSKNHLEDCVYWIIEQTLSTLVTDIQRLYLCIALGHLCMKSNVLPYPRDEKTTAMCDRFLQILNTCLNSHLLPPSNLKTLRNVATILVENSSSPGWLTLAAYFLPYLGIGFILGAKYNCQKHTYGTTEYKKMVDMLFWQIKEIGEKEQSPYQHLLELVLKKAPSFGDAMMLFERSELVRFFTNVDEKIDFFAKFCLEKMRGAGTQKIDEILDEFFNIPKKIRPRMKNVLFQTLLEFAKSDDEFHDKDGKIRSIISEQHLDLNQVFDVLRELSKSKSTRRQLLVLDILNNERFEVDWRDIYLDEKVELCKMWVINRVKTKLPESNYKGSGSRAGEIERIGEIYRACDVIIRCRLNISNKLLAQITSRVVGKLIKSEDAIPFLKALPSIENLSLVVQECYKSFVKKILKKTHVVMKRSSILLKEYSGSSLAEELLSYILDIIEVPEIKDREINEDDFHKIIDWCDVWEVFITSPGMGGKSKKKQVCKKICQKLGTCIEAGDISAKFVEMVGRKIEDVSILCAVVLHESVKSNCPIFDLQKQISDKIISLMQAVNVCSEILKLLESTITYATMIILCMERDCVLILKDLESIYGSLYDLLNQNYAVVGNRKNCRVALGAYSNPMCQVNDGFRCIVLMDEQNVYNSDPPFLNRFEKQVLRFSDVLTEEQKNVITELHLWVKKMSTVEGFESHFCERDMFIGFHEDTLPSLVLSHSSETDMEEMSKKCKEDLMWIASPDGVLRAQKCDRLKEARQEIQELSEKYFKKPLHQGFATFMEHVMNNYQKSSFFGSDEVGSKTVIMTFSNIYTDIRQCLGNRFKSQVERLSAYKSEKQLAERINAFWNAKDKKLLVLQCKPDSDAPHLLLARTIIEEKRNSYKQSSYETDTEGNKHVCIVMHVQRREIEDIPWQFSFLCGWRQVFLDVLEAPLVPLNKILGESVQQLLTSSIWPIRRFTQNDLLWCFTCIKYTQSQRPLDSVLHIAQNLFNSEKVSRAVEDLILQSISTNDHKPPDEDAQLKENWQVQVACDRQSLVNSSTLYCAMEQCVSRLVRKPLAKIVYFLEKENAWPPHLAGDFQHTRISALENLWCNFFIKNAILGISNLSEPRGAESYVLDTKRLDLSLPFIQVILRKIDSIKELFFKDCATVAENEENLDENDELTPIARQQQLERISKTIINLIPELTSISSNCHDLYLKDVLDIVTADFNETLSRSQRVSIAQATFSSEVEQHLPAEDMPQFCALLHIFVWDHREEILDSLRMIDCCRPFIGLNALSNITDDVLLSSEVTMVKINKTLPPQEQPSQELNGGNMTEEPQGTVETAKTETQEGHQAFIGLDFLPRLTDDMLYSPEVTDSTFQSSREVEYTKSEEDEFQKIRSATNETESIHDNVFNFQAEPKKDETEQNQTITVELDMKDKLRDFSEYEENDFEKIKNYESDEKDVSEEEIEDGNNSERFGDILVTVYCKEMFPSQQVVEQNGGFEMWMRNANLLLSSAFKISEQSPAFHYLRLCVDFARIIFTSIALPTSLCSLYTLNEIGLGLEPEYLDHEDSFQTITEKLIQPLEEEIGENKDKREALQKFSSLFYGRCIDTNVDTCCARPIIEQVLSLERPKLVMMMSPVVLRLLMVEEMQSPGIFIDLITNPSAIENCPCLQNINDVFEVRFSDGLINHDSYPAVMICDLIQSLLNFKEKFKIDDIVSSDSKVLMLAKSAAALISKPGENCGLSVLSAVAFLRGFFTMLAHFVCGDPGVLQDQSPYAHMMREVNSILNDSQKSLQTFFMKQLNKKASLFDIGKWFSNSCTLLSIEEQWHNERSQDKAMFTTVLKYPEYAEATEAYWKMISNETSYMEEFLKKCENSPKYAFSLIGMLINMVYLQRAVRKLNIKDEELVDWVASKIDAFPKLFQQLLLGIVGRRDFDCPELQLSPESSVEDVEMALLVLHITSVIATGPQTENVIFYQYLTNSAILENVCALAHCKDEIRSVFKYQPCVHESARVTCSCGLRLAFKSNIDKNVCPDCHETLGDDTESAASPKTNAKRPLSCHGDTIPEWALCTKHMSPAVYRALHLIVYSAFYAGIALGTSTKKDLSRVLNTLHGTDPGRNPANICFETIKTDLCVFMKILSCKKDIAIEAIHVMVEKSSDLMTSETSHGANDCLTPTMCQEWEDKFFQRVEKVVLKSYRASKGTEKMIEIQQTEDSKAMECRILERDKYPELAKEQNRQLKRLFRVTKQPCFEDFRSAFLHSPQEVQTKHSFFTLFFAKFEQFLIIGDLNHLLKWSRLVSKALTHRISRKDAQSKSIDDFIGGHLLETAQTQQQTESLQELFNNFKKAWNKMRYRVNQALVGKTEMPRLSETQCVAYCLMDGDYGIYLKTAIEILVSYQNSIMDTVISFSLHQHPGLSFLERENCSGVMSASIQDVKEKEIINFQWSDDFFQDAQNNLEYGKGREITYDFERMEMVIAKEIVFGKCFLTGTLNKFVFAKELFHSCGPLLSEIRSQVAQEQSLPDDVRKGLSNLKERRIKEAQDLLQHIEVLIFLLKRELKKINVDMTLEEFAENWSPMLPSPFPAKLLPEPRRLIKIRHLAALYEALEDVLADGAIEGLADKFRKKLPDEIEESVSTMVGKDIEQLKPPNFLKALRRFIFRYLSSETEKYWPEERKSLQSCLEEPSLWFPLQPPHLNDIPREITLKYIHSIVKYLDEKEKVGESKKESLRVSSVQQKTTKQSGGRRRLKNFSRA
ncbi:uncharacterized protein LOC114536632 [Dendronephthya gigantea]|uniref:uncharacterized protein LOC114536632 n=1 Tax=Dendronephthya gigantea TaxID=151771 RepID=UPI00106AEC30|nr:uncharacterized protein LOC114536632 [Dendronephthya gigantea]